MRIAVIGRPPVENATSYRSLFDWSPVARIVWSSWIVSNGRLLLADVGFALLPEALTERPSVLSPQEYAELRVFMMRAVQSLIGRGRLSDAMMRRVIVAYEHHEPQRDAHLYSRIVAVADAFDALVSGRPWRAPNEPTVALAMLRQDRQRFDPLVVETLWSLYSTAAAA
mgnify:CR=1 FL=1